MNSRGGIADDLKAYLSKSSSKIPSSSSSRENLVPSEQTSGIRSWFSQKFSRSSTPSSPSESSTSASSTYWFPSSSSSNGNNEDDSSWLSRKQRILGFVLCLIGGVVCFGMASLYLPVLLLKARKFALLFSLGSLFVISSFSFLWGFAEHMKHLFSRERFPFTSVYFTTLFLTIYFALGLRSTLLTIISSIFQVLALMWYIISYLPGGQRGLSIFSKLFYRTASSTVTSTLNVWKRKMFHWYVVGKGGLRTYFIFPFPLLLHVNISVYSRRMFMLPITSLFLMCSLVSRRFFNILHSLWS